jgi:RNA polymerase sigma factor (TIGR02999 family)
MDRTFASLAASAQSGDPAAAEALFGLLYAELHRLAKRELGRQQGQQQEHLTLGATTLLHEAYMDMSERDGTTFPDRARFMGYAARVMRGLIIEHARNRRALKRGGGFEIPSLQTDAAAAAVDAPALARLSDALDELATLDTTLAHIVDLKFFCGFSFAEIAAMQGVSVRTVQRNWEKARIYLHQALRADMP